MAKRFVEAGVVVLTAFISRFRADRLKVRNLTAPGDFIEIYCRCPIEVCEQRDVKVLYCRARTGEIRDFTGISSPYEEPESPKLSVDTGSLPLGQCVDQVVSYLQDCGAIPQPQGVI